MVYRIVPRALAKGGETATIEGLWGRTSTGGLEWPKGSIWGPPWTEPRLRLQRHPPVW